MNQDIRFCKSSDGVTLAYAVSGEGPPVVMSATWLTHLEHQWRSLAWQPWLDVCSRGHKLLRYDSRGCGLSDRNTSDFSFENWLKERGMIDDGSIAELKAKALREVNDATDWAEAQEPPGESDLYTHVYGSGPLS